jgi:Uma2 family endonuclease
MGLTAEKQRHTIAEYLRQEEQASQRHEFHEGEILAMAGGTYRHSAIVANLLRSLGNRLDGKPCRPLDSNMRVRIPTRAIYLYPDVTVVCGPPQFDADDPKQTTLTNPRLVVEVLSETTESYDRGQKFEFYRDIPSLTEYVLVSQDQASVETFFRQEDGGWAFHPWKGLAAVAALRSLAINLPLAEVYAAVEFERVNGGAAGV